MRYESIFILNDIEKGIAEDLIRKLSVEGVPAKGRNAKVDLNYNYHAGKREKIITGTMLGCPYKLRYRDNKRVFFSAWNCRDVCSVFYDVIWIIHIFIGEEINIPGVHIPFDVDMRTERYVFFAVDAAASLILMTDYTSKEPHKIRYSSQYILSVFEESDECAYNALIRQLKTEGYSKIQILQIWIRGEILYYAIADGAVLRPEHQRMLTSKEEKDIIRKTYKVVNDKFKLVDLHA